eukprot:1998683-Pyramimonas_sp.AAC.1
MTVGSLRPVISLSCEICSATSTRALTFSGAKSPCAPDGSTYVSRYMRIVAPTTPVPKTTTLRGNCRCRCTLCREE